MKAVVIDEHGGVEKLRYTDVPEPKIGPTDVLVEVKACALNHLDLWLREGIPGIQIPMPHILGSDVSGILREVGDFVKHVKVGDRVLIAPGIGCGVCRECLSGKDNLCSQYTLVGYLVDGGYAEFVKVPGENALPIPEPMDFNDAAAVPLVFLTAWHMLVRRAQLRAGEDVLVLAAGSGVGSAAIQIAKLLGARVIATASTDEKLARAKDLGADEVINYQRVDFANEVRRLTNKKGVEVVLEHVGADTWPKSILALTRGGRLVTCGATSGAQAKTDLRYLFARELTIYGSYMGSKGELFEVLKFFKEGKLKAVVDRVLPLKEAALGHRLLMDRKQFGKIVLNP